MAGREDFEERKQEKIERLNEASNKAAREAHEAYERSHNLTKDIPFGQPNIEGRMTGLLNKSNNAMDRAMKLSDKAEYYENRAYVAENNKAISSDDPKAIDKLNAKLEKLEAQREAIKAENKARKKAGEPQHPPYILTNLAGTIRATKLRIKRLQATEARPAVTIEFEDGKIVENVENNRVQILFNDRPDKPMIDKLKSSGFHWSPTEKAWQRLRTGSALYSAKRICLNN